MLERRNPENSLTELSKKMDVLILYSVSVSCSSPTINYLKKIFLYKWFQLGEILPRKGHLTMAGGILVVTTCRTGASGIHYKEARDATKYPTIHKRASNNKYLTGKKIWIVPRLRSLFYIFSYFLQFFFSCIILLLSKYTSYDIKNTVTLKSKNSKSRDIFSACFL